MNVESIIRHSSQEMKSYYYFRDKMTCIKDGATIKWGNLKKEIYGNKSCPVSSLSS